MSCKQKAFSSRRIYLAGEPKGGGEAAWNTRRGASIREELCEALLAQRRRNFGFRANGTPAVPSRVLNISAIAMLII